MYYSGDEEHMYVTSVSSISKNIPWKDLTLVIEYDSNNSECWKTICNGQNVAHSCVKLNTFSLKTLNDIKNSELIKGILKCLHFYNYYSNIFIIFILVLEIYIFIFFSLLCIS